MANDPSLMLTIPEASEALRISKSKLYQLVGEGKLRIRKIGHRSLIARDDLERFAANLSS